MIPQEKGLANLLLLIQSNQEKTEAELKKIGKKLEYTVKKLKSVASRIEKLEGALQ